MPSFGGFATNSFSGALVRNAVGTVANAVFPRSTFGGLGGVASSLVGQDRISQDADNRRVSLKPRPGGASTVYGNGLLNPLKAAGGLVWPYTPTINYSSDVDYQTIQTVHSNQDFHMFSKTPAVSLTVDGEFTVQNQMEGKYALAAIHFLRTMSKMNFGDSDPLAGTPPPILLFNAYGPFVFNNVPVIVKGFNISFPNEVDYVQVQVQGSQSWQKTIAGQRFAPPVPEGEDTPAGSVTVERNGQPVVFNNPAIPNPFYAEQAAAGAATMILPSRVVTGSTAVTYTVWLPSQFKISATLITQHTPKTLRSRFNLPAYRNGAKNQSDFI
jgi:hypothetical protein